MWIGVFDSGLGGLVIAEAIRKRLPEYDYLYLGDTKRAPYGNRSQETIHGWVSQALNFLFEHDCRLVILACNTASAEALRKSQREYLPRFYPERRILGVIIPTVEAVIERGEAGKCGVIATTSTVSSGAYQREFERMGPDIELVQQAAPLLVPMIENDGIPYIEPVLGDYLKPVLNCAVSTVVLGCTHYALIKDLVRAQTDAWVVSQDELIPDKVADYLKRHPEMDSHLGKSGQSRFCVTETSPSYGAFASRLVGRAIDLEQVVLA